MPVLRGLRRRLDRLWAAHQRVAAVRDDEAERLNARAIFVRTLRAGLVHAGIDPATVPALRRFDGRHAFAGAAPAYPPSDDPIAMLRDQLSRLARHCRERPFDLNSASPMALFAAYCFDETAEGIPVLVSD
jgi:hypothetical protein